MGCLITALLEIYAKAAGEGMLKIHKYLVKL